MSQWGDTVRCLVEQRKAWGLKVEEAAEVIGIATRTLYYWEACRKVPSASEFLIWADALACDIVIAPRK